MTQSTSDKLRFPDKVTIGDLYCPAMDITDQAEADTYLEALVERNMRFGTISRFAAEKIERDNLGYFAWHHDVETRLRIERLFRCAHPIFGPASKGRPTADEALEAGVRAGKGAPA